MSTRIVRSFPRGLRQNLCRVVPAGIALSLVALGTPVSVQTQTPDLAVVPGALSPQNSRPQHSLLQTPITLRLDTVTVRAALDAIIRESRIRLSYKPASLPADRRVTIRATQMPTKDVLAQVLNGLNLEVRAVDDSNFVLVKRTAEGKTSSSLEQGTQVLSGRVIDSTSRKGIVGATVSIGGTKISTMTRENGAFTLRGLPMEPHLVVVKIFGYKTRSEFVTVKQGESSSVTLALVPVATSLTEVVTTATGSQERIKIGSDIVKINVDSVLRNAPVTNMSELLTTRVPGALVMKTSGAPGAPSVIRIRGVNSLSLNNDPIIIVDGVRMYSTVSDSNDQNNATRQGGGATAFNRAYRSYAPSALDQIDPNNVESVEVLRGPSASALYGTDAANGIIVITTKKGRMGPTRWTFGTQQGVESVPGSYPLFYQLWGRTPDGSVVRCALNSSSVGGNFICTEFDSVASFQYLNNDRTTFLGRGSRQQYSAGVSGGSQTLQYAINVNSANTIGYQKMPDAEVARLERLTGNRVPSWQRRPLGASTVNGAARVTIRLSETADLAFTSNVGRETTRATPVAGALREYLSLPDRSDTAITSSKIPDYRRKTETARVTSLFAVNGQWRPLTSTVLNADLGWNRTDRNDVDLIRRDDCPACETSNPSRLGQYGGTQSTADVLTLNTRGSLNLLHWGIVSGPTSIGLNYVRNIRNEMRSIADGLAAGSSSLVGAQTITTTNITGDARVAGIFFDQRIGLFNRFYTGFGFRMDAGSGIGARASLPTYPKLDFSIPILTGERPWHQISTFRIRTAFGHSGVQPDITARLRTYQAITTSGSSAGFTIKTIGNTKLRPERSVEFEGGFELGVLDDRFLLNLTGYRKRTRDAIMGIQLPLSVNGGIMQSVNIGTVSNTGLNADFTARILDGELLQWQLQMNVGANRNRLLSANRALNLPVPVTGQRMVEGYPLAGWWAQPLIAYADVNGDRIITKSEIQLSDSSRFIGGPYPKYDMAFGTSVGLFRGRVNVSTTFNYQHGMVRANEITRNSVDPFGLPSSWKIFNDTTTSLRDQADALAGSAYFNPVSTLRLNELSINYIVPQRFARYLKAGDMQIALQGSNLRLWTTYSGKDPNVRSSQVAEAPTDTGQLPPPRLWMLNIRLGR